MASVVGSTKWVAVAVAGALALTASAACIQLPAPLPLSARTGGDSSAPDAPAQVAPTSDALTVAAAPTPRASGPHTVAVKRDSITQTLALDGVVAAVDQSTVTSSVRGTVLTVNVKAGDIFKQGDSLLDFDPTDLAKTLEAAQARLKQAQDNLAQGQAQAQAAHDAANAKLADQVQQQQQTITNLQVQLTRAQQNLATVKAGPPAATRQVAETSLSYYGDTTVKQAQDALNVALAGPDPAAIQAAQKAVSDDQSALVKAQSALTTATNGPDPSAVRTAQAAVDRAQTQLSIAQATKPDPKLDPSVAKLQHDAAVTDAQVSVQNAQAALNKLKAPPSDTDVQAAQRAVQDAQGKLAADQASLDKLNSGPDQTAVDNAQHNLEYAKHTQAEMAQSVAEMESHPTPAELAQAQDQVTAAQQALAAASKPIVQQDPGGPNLAQLQTAVDQAQSDVDAAQQAVDNTHVRAPFDGAVVAVRVRPNSAVTLNQALVVLAQPGSPVVRVTLDDSDVAQLSAGQQGTVQLATGSSSSPSVPATLTSVTPAAADGSTPAFAVLEVQWPDSGPPRYNLPVQVQVTTQQKDDVLVVPTSALHTLGNQTSVEVLNGSLRKFVNVQVGIKTDTNAEIVGGLSEGQMVILTNS